MTTPVKPLLPVDPPALCGPNPYGLFSAATVVENTTGAALAGVTFEHRCDPQAHTWPGPCPDNPVTEEKQLPGPLTTVEGLPFAVYAWERCPLVSYTQSELQDRARANLRCMEQNAVERALWEGEGDHVGFCQRDDVTNLNPAGAVSIVEAVALAEWWLSQRCCPGILHTSTAGAAPAVALLVADRDGQVYRTPLRHAWSFGGGYPNCGPQGAAPEAGAWWLWVTGPITLRRSPTRVTYSLRPQNNEQRAFAERMYVPTVPCPIAAVQVKIMCSDQPLPPALTARKRGK